MKLALTKKTSSKIIHAFIQDTSAVDGSGLTGLVFNSAGLVAYYIRPGDTGEIAITLATATVGTWVSGGFVEVDAANMPGVYEFGIPDNALESGSEQCVIMLHGATNMSPVLMEIQLDLDEMTADAILRRDWTAVTNEATRSVLNALRALRNRVRLASGTMTVYKEDDTTTAWTAVVKTDAAALPVTEIDP